MGESMKRLFVFAIALILLLVLTACAGNTAPTEPVVTEAPTDAPYIDTQIDEPEWTLAEGVLRLADAGTTDAEGSEIVYFAIVTKTDGSQELLFRVDDAAAAALTAQSPDTEYYVTLNGEYIGKASLNKDCTVATVKQEDVEGSITALASRIRGLSE